MSTALSLATQARNAATNAVVDLTDAGGSIKIYSGAMPAASAAATGTLLASITTPSNWFGASSDGTAQASSVVSGSSGAANGTAGYFRMCDSGGSVVWQGEVGTVGSGKALELNTTAIVTTMGVTITRLTYTTPESC